MAAPTRIDWPSGLTRGARYVPVLLVAGVPRVVVPAGVAPTTVAASSGSLDALWWPGDGSLTQSLPGGVTFDPVRGWLDPEETFEVYEEARLLEGDTRVEALTLSLYDPPTTTATGGQVTSDLSVREARTAQLLASDIDDTDTAIPLVSSAGFPSSGIACVGRETLIYNTVLANDLAITGSPGGRGKYGSRARHHRSPEIHRPLVVAEGPRHWQGRIATLWLARLSSDGATLTDPTLLYVGTIGAGVQLIRGGARWSLPIDHASEALTRKLEKRSVSLYGYAHYGLGIDCPLVVTWAGTFGLDATDDARNSRGWHPSREVFFRDWDGLADVDGRPLRCTSGPGRVVVSLYSSADPQGCDVTACWDDPPSRSFTVGDTSTTPGTWVSSRAAPEACLHLDGRVHLGDALDVAKVPATLSWIVSTPSAAEARLALTADTDHTKGLVARIVSSDLAHDELTVSAVLPADTTISDRERATRITRRTSASLGLVARGDTALGALRAIGEALEELQGMDLHDAAVDWDGIAAVFAGVPTGAIPEAREYKIAGGDTLLDLLVDELRLRGCALVVRRGLLSATRSQDYAATETQRATITQGDLVRDGETGEALDVEVVDNVQPLATSMTFELAGGSTFSFVDVTRQDEFGDGAEVKCSALKHLPAGSTIASTTDALQRIAQQLLGPRSEPYRLVRVTLPATFLHLDAGDVVSFTHPMVPTWRGTRGVSEAPCQVLEVRRQVFGGKARAVVGLRLQAGTYYGYAPAALVAAGGISGAVLTFDVTAGWGANGFGAPFDETGAAVTDPLDGFAVDDEVQLVEIDAESPATPETFSIVSIDRTAHTITLSGSPTGTFTALAASAYKVMLKYVAYSSAGMQQWAYAFIADAAAGDLGSGGAPDRWAA